MLILVDGDLQESTAIVLSEGDTYRAIISGGETIAVLLGSISFVYLPASTLRCVSCRGRGITILSIGHDSDPRVEMSHRVIIKATISAMMRRKKHIEILGNIQEPRHLFQLIPGWRLVVAGQQRFDAGILEEHNHTVIVYVALRAAPRSELANSEPSIVGWITRVVGAIVGNRLIIAFADLKILDQLWFLLLCCGIQDGRLVKVVGPQQNLGSKAVKVQDVIDMVHVRMGNDDIVQPVNPVIVSQMQQRAELRIRFIGPSAQVNDNMATIG